MIYKLEFEKRAMKEWNKLTPDIRNQLKNKLAERLESPFIRKDKLLNMKDCYKIKLRNSGYRLVYAVIESRIVILVLAVGRREREEVYKNAKNRL
jgi:mRNA interferase RelE/StbE